MWELCWWGRFLQLPERWHQTARTDGVHWRAKLLLLLFYESPLLSSSSLVEAVLVDCYQLCAAPGCAVMCEQQKEKGLFCLANDTFFLRWHLADFKHCGTRKSSHLNCIWMIPSLHAARWLISSLFFLETLFLISSVDAARVCDPGDVQNERKMWHHEAYHKSVCGETCFSVVTEAWVACACLLCESSLFDNVRFLFNSFCFAGGF